MSFTPTSNNSRLRCRKDNEKPRGREKIESKDSSARCAICFRPRNEQTESGSEEEKPLELSRPYTPESVAKTANLCRNPKSAKRFALLITFVCGTSLVSAAQSIQSSLLMPLKAEAKDAPYSPITPRQSLQWFIASTAGPPHLAGAIFVSACGTALDRPKEYGTHWGGLASRFGMGMAGSATSNAIEASAGLILREDPRYFRVPQLPFKSRLRNVVWLTFSARTESGRLGPAYSRYMGIVGGNFLSNTWRVPSEANVHDAVRRASEGFAGRMAANAFAEFRPDIKRAFHKHK